MVMPLKFIVSPRYKRDPIVTSLSGAWVREIDPKKPPEIPDDPILIDRI